MSYKDIIDIGVLASVVLILRLSSGIVFERDY